MGDVLSINITPSDFVRDTQHLTTTEVGAYTLICHQIVTVGQNAEPPSIPDDDVMLANITRLPVREWKKMKPRLCSGDMAVLTLAQGRISQVRVVYEIYEARKRIEGSSKAGKASGEARRAKREIRERLLNGRSNIRSTPVAVPFDASSLEQSNGTRTSHESLVTKEEETMTLPSVASSSDDAAETAVAVVQRTLRFAAPRARVSVAQVEKWLTAYCRDPWVLSAILCDKLDYLANAASAAYITRMLDERKRMNGDGFVIPHAQSYVEHVLERREKGGR